MKTYNLTKRDYIFALLGIIAGFLFAAFGLFYDFAIGYTIAFVLTNVLFSVYLLGKSKKVTAFGVACEVLALMLSVNFTVTGNGSVKFWSFVVSLVLTAVWLESIVNKTKDSGDMGLVKKLCNSLFIKACGKMPKTLVSLFSGGGKKRSTFLKVLIGIACAIPVVFVIVPLLASGDAAFYGLVSGLINNILLIFFELFVTVIIAPFVISYGIALANEEVKEIPKKEGGGLDKAFVIPFLSVISVCYLAYIFSQFAYFFSAFRGILPDGYEFVVSQYARRGFFEMCIIAAINIVIIFAALFLSKKKNGLVDTATKILCLFIGLVTVLIASTAISKMVLYIKSFGMTELRITTTAFVVFLIVLMLALMVRCFAKNVPVIKIGLIAAAVILAVLGLANVNQIVADYNYSAYKNQILSEIDVETIAEVGDEGIPYLVELTKDADNEVAELAKERMLDAICNHYYTYDDVGKRLAKDFREYNIPKIRAYKLLDEYIEANNIDLENLYGENVYEENVYEENVEVY